jgi:hypothetical protein
MVERKVVSSAESWGPLKAVMMAILAVVVKVVSMAAVKVVVMVA